MTDKTRIRVAALVTALFLAVISTAGLATHAAPQPSAATNAAPAAAAPAPQTSAAPVVRASDDDEYTEEDGGEHD